MAPAVRRDPQEEVRRADRRWLLIAAAVFAGSVASLLALHGLYRVTGPHPQVTVFLRRVKLFANSLLRQGRLRRVNRK